MSVLGIFFLLQWSAGLCIVTECVSVCAVFGDCKNLRACACVRLCICMSV